MKTILNVLSLRMILGINHVTVVVKNKPEAELFYFNLLGLEKILVGKSLWAKVGSQFIHISENPEYVPQNTFHHFAIEVEDIKKYCSDLINKGLTIFDLDDSLTEIDLNSNLEKKQRNYFTKDPSGNIVEFVDAGNLFFKNES